MYAKQGNLVDADASGAKANTKHCESCLFKGHSRSRILGSLKRRRGNPYYCIIKWALESEISKEMSDHLRFREPRCHSAPLV